MKLSFPVLWKTRGRRVFKMAAVLSPSDTEDFEVVLQVTQRDINCLSDDNRTTRRRALDKILKDVLQRKPPLSAQVLQSLLDELVKPLLKVMSDPTEKCRDLSVQIMSEFADKIVDVSVFLPYIIPTISQRLGQPEIVENCEELRLALVKLLTTVTKLCQNKMAVYIDDMIKIFQRTNLDPFHEVRKESFKCINVLAPAIPEQFYFQGNSLVSSLLKTISHQHSKVRVACIETIGVVIQYGDGKNVDDVTSHLAQRTFDSSPTVRAMVTSVVGDWLLNLRDRYSYFHKLLPYLLTGLSDEMPDIRNKSRELMDQVGDLYAKENEEELKDKINFDEPPTYRLITDIPRPSLGCRILIHRNLSKILPAALRDMTDWTVDTRKKASALVYNLLFYAEDNTTQHMEVLLNGLYKGCQDEEKEVVSQVIASAELAGSFVDPAVFCKLALPHLKTSATSSSQSCTNCLTILAALIHGCNPELLVPQLQYICETICLPEVSCAEQQSTQQQLLILVNAVLQKAGTHCTQYSYQLFTVIMHVKALQTQSGLEEEVMASLQMLATIQNLQSIQQLYEKHSEELLTKLKASHMSWTSHSPERQLFDVLLTNAGPVTGQVLLADAMPIFASCFDINRDPEMRLKTFSLMSRLVMDASKSEVSIDAFKEYSLAIVKDMIIPNCVWQTGRTASAVRAAAVSCLWAVLQAGLLTDQQAKDIMKELLTQLNTCLDDHNQTTRLVSCKALQKLLISCKDSFNADTLHQIYPELTKRMDDSSDEIRIMVTKTFLAFFRAFPADYDRDLYKFHLQSMFKGLLIHLDDPTASIQESVLAALLEAVHIAPNILQEQVEAVKHKHRVARFCNEILKEIQSHTAMEH
ncbi:dynein assembly factor 5, axonemal-like [Actinia tenebrosa]|uniref:Dynein assembly factor 5, axonemal-like n=1 Tax=Actinia tenebrosa TaxID=6105 RepID=A0A6P8HK36_ACTTE|nr:dynein assembly factor 5, axonemal-like [Actinia tenebrosa]